MFFCGRCVALKFHAFLNLQLIPRFALEGCAFAYAQGHSRRPQFYAT